MSGEARRNLAGTGTGTSTSQYTGWQLAGTGTGTGTVHRIAQVGTWLTLALDRVIKFYMRGF